MVEGLRTRKKERTRQAISEVAIAMFLEHGFDRVGVAEIAVAAEVSKPTLFRYFPSKEDLVLHRIADHRGEAAAVVRARQAGRTPLDALHDAFMAGLDAREPTTGLCDHPAVMAYHRLVFDTPSLASRVAEYAVADTEALAQALREAAGTDSDPVPRPTSRLTSRLVAAQYVAVRQILARDNYAALASGRTAGQVYGEAVAAAGTAFELLRHGARAHGL
ncbi:TetR/AcrR family transcriptional regulator [Microbispora bryophytorum]|uniref:TetR family transcriptional regulator n=1 Tax=Microbispora bryophytorum TaxID=1460882 RepID=A0A8H9L902_9ACTN|nr:TetR/AcrR family transcriptional regulator [Microbispora bryophytorum]MBD3135987.1 TetR/AcrR family transcriptional regulator [Microbispora bryophytorum]TQS07752.1 TetR/AcrR family transcriptional regulator [Microbispora bryophytorum]GGO03854.1 TetR family transcriptional regulator [Microbispora bryophytorum]